MAQQGAQKTARGFASMDEAKQREIASKGGRAAHLKGTAHEFDSREAALAGKKGGEIVSQNRAHMAAIGAEGGRARSEKRRQLGIVPPRESTTGQSSQVSNEAAREAEGDDAEEQEPKYRIGA